MRKGLLALAILLLATGCSSSGSENAAPSAARPAAVDSQDGSLTRAAAPQEAAGSPAQDQVTGQRAVAYSATLRIRADRVEQASDKAKGLVTAAGGYVAEERSQGTPPSAELTFQVPAAKYPAVLGDLSRKLGEKLSLEQSAEDVTEKVADVDSRVQSAESAIKRLRALLSRAGTVGEVLQVTDELDRRQADLDSLKARQKALSQRVTYASITLVVTSERAQAAEDDPSGFLGGLKQGWDDFTAFISGALTMIGWLVPFAVLLLVVGAPVRLLLRRRRRRRQAA